MRHKTPNIADALKSDSAAAARDMLTKQLILASIHGRVLSLPDMRKIVDRCRKSAAYIQKTNETLV